MRIQTNIESLNAYRNLNTTNRAMSRSLERLSSGFRINRAADDAAGLAISEKMRSQIRGIGQAVRNAQDGISLIQTAEGALNETHAILQRMRELAVQAATETYEAGDVATLQEEITELVEELDRIANNTEFNQKTLLDGSLTLEGEGEGLTIHIGANAGQSIVVGIDDMSASELGIDMVNVAEDAGAAITAISAAIDDVSSQRSTLGAVQNRLEHTITNLEVAAENLTGAESRIRDVDMAAEMMEFTKNQILTQAGVAMLAQANMAPQAVLQLLG